jgi:2-keto-4-pentenoate hydratase/2-oxohepta-3-ene-1,7-dioic acid hydratase in catechol pathway
MGAKVALLVWLQTALRVGLPPAAVEAAGFAAPDAAGLALAEAPAAADAAGLALAADAAGDPAELAGLALAATEGLAGAAELDGADAGAEAPPHAASATAVATGHTTFRSNPAISFLLSNVVRHLIPVVSPSPSRPYNQRPMKLVTFSVLTPIGRFNRLGALLDGGQDGRIADLTTAYAVYLGEEAGEPTPVELASVRMPPDMIGWLRGGAAAREAAETAVEYAKRRLDRETQPRGANGAQLVFARSEVRLLSPLPRPRSLRDFSIYEEHMSKAGGGERRKDPIWYRWPPYYKGNVDAIYGPEDDVPYPYYTDTLDLELEIGIVVGKEGRNLSFEQAREHIAGYTILVDASAREGHKREPFGPNKRKDFCTVLGPCLVTADELDETNLDVRFSVDGEVWYEGNTGHRRSFLAEQLVAYASDNETVYPGDVLGTGTVGLQCSMDSGRWIKPGQRATFEVEGIGSLTHRIEPGEHVVDYVKNGMEGLLRPPA